jgi:hypothetical protein
MNLYPILGPKQTIKDPVIVTETRQIAKQADTRVYPKVSGLSRNEINNNNNKHSLRRNTKRYGGKIHQNDSQK